ncbi:hypothetical protein C8R44DRAFT_780334, partial [Mycena epipterygia]
MKFNALLSLAVVCFATLASSAPAPDQITVEITIHGQGNNIADAHHPVSLFTAPFSSFSNNLPRPRLR